MRGRWPSGAPGGRTPRRRVLSGGPVDACSAGCGARRRRRARARPAFGRDRSGNNLLTLCCAAVSPRFSSLVPSHRAPGTFPAVSFPYRALVRNALLSFSFGRVLRCAVCLRPCVPDCQQWTLVCFLFLFLVLLFKETLSGRVDCCEDIFAVYRRFTLLLCRTTSGAAAARRLLFGYRSARTSEELIARDFACRPFQCLGDKARLKCLERGVSWRVGRYRPATARREARRAAPHQALMACSAWRSFGPRTTE